MDAILSWGGLLLGVILGFCCAKGAKALGHQIAVTRFTVATSVRDTINRHVAAFGVAALAGILFVIAAAALIIFTPESASSWAPLASKVVGFAANLTLGLAAGIGSHVAGILEKPALLESIECALEMKRRTRRHLTKFLVAVALSTAALAGHSQAAEPMRTTWVWAIDVTDSVDPVQRKEATARLSGDGLEMAQRLGAGLIQVVRFDEATMLSDSTWVPVPQSPKSTDCQKARPSMSGIDSFMGLSPGLMAKRKEEAVAFCLSQEHDKASSYSSEVQKFLDHLEAATTVTPRANVTTRIVPLLQWLVTRRDVLAIAVVTDGIDRSRVPLSALRIPDTIPVTLIITRPNPRRTHPTLNDVLSMAAAWARVPGFRITSAGDPFSTQSMLAEARP